MRPFRQSLAYLFLIIGLCGVAWPQASFTSLRGTITDPSGALIPGADVSIVNNANGLKSTQIASGSGEYQFQQIPPGTYVITANGSGFSPQSKQADLLVNQPATINFKLTVQSTAITVDVSGEAETLNTIGCFDRQLRQQRHHPGAADGRAQRDRPAEPATGSFVSWPADDGPAGPG